MSRPPHPTAHAGYEVDDLDLDAIEAGLSGTDADRGSWFHYPLVADEHLDVGLARGPEAHPVMVRVSGSYDDVMAARIETLLAVSPTTPGPAYGPERVPVALDRVGLRAAG